MGGIGRIEREDEIGCVEEPLLKSPNLYERGR